MPFGWIIAGLFAWMFASGGSGKKKATKVTTGTATLYANHAYRIEIDVSGAALQANPALVAYSIQSSLIEAGAYDVMAQASIPMRVTYSMVQAGTTPVVLNVPATQSLGGVSAEYTFRSVQEIALPRPTARAA